MASSTHAELKVPSDRKFLTMALGFVRELGVLAGLPDKRVKALELAAEEAVLNSMTHAFEPGETGQITVAGELTKLALHLSIRDEGLPFDGKTEKEYKPPSGKDISEIEDGGLGTHLIREMVDEVQWINHGWRGKELRLTVQRPELDISERLSGEELAPFKEGAPLAPHQEYAIRRLRPKDGIQVSRCIYRTYGLTYPNEDLYYPERVAHLNETGELVSAVALDAKGEVVGHYALERWDLGPVAESGQAVVIPAHRSRGLMEKMRFFLEEEGRRIGLRGIYGLPVTRHVFSQRVNEKFGSRPTAVLVGILPRSFRFKKIGAELFPQRGSCLIYWKDLGEPPPTRVFAPPRHREMLSRIYENLKIPVEFGEPAPPAGAGRLSVSCWGALEIGTIRVEEAGADTPVEIRRALRDVCEIAGAEAVYLLLPLSQPGTPALCEAAEAAGFFFSGLAPGFLPDGDALELQYLAEGVEISPPEIHNPFGHEIFEYAWKEKERVGRPVGG